MHVFRVDLVSAIQRNALQRGKCLKRQVSHLRTLFCLAGHNLGHPAGTNLKISLHSFCKRSMYDMMYRWMLEQVVAVATAVLSNIYTSTLRCVATSSVTSSLQAPVVNASVCRHDHYYTATLLLLVVSVTIYIYIYIDIRHASRSCA
jgi:hypothetical protein